MIFSIILLFVVIFAVNFYVFDRISKAVKYFTNKGTKIICIVLSFLSTCVLVFGFSRSMIFDSDVIKIFLKVVFSYWLGFFIYLLIFIVVADIVYALVCISKSAKARKLLIRMISVLCAITLALLVSVYGFYHATVICEKEYNITLKDNLSDDMKIVLVSDLHLGATGSEQRLGDLVQCINKKNADIVCFLGDIFDNDYNAIEQPETAVDILSEIKSNYGVYAVFGNHDAGESVSMMKDFIIECGFNLLQEDYVIIDNRLALVGRADSSPIGGASVKRVYDNELLSAICDDLPIIVMDHNPHNASKYTDRVDLVLSGHTHKGQLFPANFITGTMYEVDYGYGVLSNGVQIVVTSGFGTWGMPMRVGTDSEIVTINIK